MKCARTHFVRYVAAKIMWRPLNISVEISATTSLDAT
jgi:hypothetical protein